MPPPRGGDAPGPLSQPGESHQGAQRGPPPHRGPPLQQCFLHGRQEGQGHQDGSQGGAQAKVAHCRSKTGTPLLRGERRRAKLPTAVTPTARASAPNAPHPASLVAPVSACSIANAAERLLFEWAVPFVSVARLFVCGWRASFFCGWRASFSCLERKMAVKGRKRHTRWAQTILKKYLQEISKISMRPLPDTCQTLPRHSPETS